MRALPQQLLPLLQLPPVQLQQALQVLQLQVLCPVLQPRQQQQHNKYMEMKYGNLLQW